MYQNDGVNSSNPFITFVFIFVISDCGDPVNSDGYTITGNTGTTAGSTATVECTTGFFGSPADITCTSGSWTTPSGCEKGILLFKDVPYCVNNAYFL